MKATLLKWWHKWFPAKKRVRVKRICANCGCQIHQDKEKESWSAKWPDGKPRHWHCPTAQQLPVGTLEAQEVASGETL